MQLQNKRMQNKLEKGEAIDISAFWNEEEKIYILDDFKEDVDYCDADKEIWIWSIRLEYKTALVKAATDTRFYLNKNYECLFLR